MTVEQADLLIENVIRIRECIEYFVYASSLVSILYMSWAIAKKVVKLGRV